MEPIQVILLIFVLFALSRAYLRYSEGKIKITEFAFWIIIWGSATAAALSPKIVGFFSNLIGIGRPADLIIYVAIILLFYLIFRSYVMIDEIDQKMTKIVRELAIDKQNRNKKK